MANPLRPYPARAPAPLGRGSVATPLAQDDTRVQPMADNPSGRTSAVPLVPLAEREGRASPLENGSAGLEGGDALAFEFYPASSRVQPASFPATAVSSAEAENVDPGALAASRPLGLARPCSHLSHLY